MFVGQFYQPIVRDADHRVGMLLQFFQARRGHRPPSFPFERERQGDKPDDQRPLFMGQPRHQWCGTAAGAAAQAGCHEHQVGALDRMFQALEIDAGRPRAQFRVPPGTETVGDAGANLDPLGGGHGFETLQVGVHRD